jgi:hypothetical protein
MFLFHSGRSCLRGKKTCPIRPSVRSKLLRNMVARVAQLVEQRIENPRVTGSIPVPGTTYFPKLKT